MRAMHAGWTRRLLGALLMQVASSTAPAEVPDEASLLQRLTEAKDQRGEYEAGHRSSTRRGSRGALRHAREDLGGLRRCPAGRRPGDRPRLFLAPDALRLEPGFRSMSNEKMKDLGASELGAGTAMGDVRRDYAATVGPERLAGNVTFVKMLGAWRIEGM